jgi:peptidoglycan/xylan/chitin deacetylase (PgdA/CDA1 family)
MSRAADPDAPALTIVMYHIVRAGRGITARLKGLELDEFRGQLEYIRANYTPVDLLEAAKAAETGEPLPPRSIALTFDDGYACHRELVFPLLRDTRTPATFFPVASSMLDGAVLDVNKIQLILAATPDVAPIVSAIDDAVVEAIASGGPSLAEYRRSWWKASRWDPPEVVYVKRSLQHALPEDARGALVDDVFRRVVSTDERAVGAELYMTAEDAREMRNGGMTIGAHGDRHVRLSTLSREEQAMEIDGALRVLDAVGLPRHDFAYCYANGDYTADAVDLLRARACRVAVTTEPEIARLARDRLLTLPRVDTNDLPARPRIAP